MCVYYITKNKNEILIKRNLINYDFPFFFGFCLTCKNMNERIANC